MNTMRTRRRSVTHRLAQATAGVTATLALGLGLPAPAGAQVTGTVQIYADINYGGSSWGFPMGGNHPNLGSISFNDRISSIRVPAGTVVAAFEHSNYEGRCETFRVNDSDLRNNLIGQDSITSLRIGQPCPPRLYDDGDYGGSYVNFVGDIPDLGVYGFSDRGESLQLAQGSRVALFDQPNYQGLCEVFTSNDQNFENNPIRDRASSLRVNADCPRQAVLFEHSYYGGEYLIVPGSIDMDWSDYWDWKDRASSVHVTAGACLSVENNWQEDVVLIGVLLRWFSVSERFTADDPDLRNNVVTNDGIDEAALC